MHPKPAPVMGLVGRAKGDRDDLAFDINDPFWQILIVLLVMIALLIPVGIWAFIDHRKDIKRDRKAKTERMASDKCHSNDEEEGEKGCENESAGGSDVSSNEDYEKEDKDMR